jgi:hypothetical protein
VSQAPDIGTLLARIERLERELARRQDLDEIQAVLERYARAVDWLDEELLKTVFWDDADVDYGFFKGTGRDFRPVLMDVDRSIDKRWHTAPNVAITLEGEVAHVASYQFSVSYVPGNPRPQTELMHAYGYYLDRMEKRNGRWGIARRKHVAVAGTMIPDGGERRDVRGAKSPRRRLADARGLSRAIAAGAARHGLSFAREARAARSLEGGRQRHQHLGGRDRRRRRVLRTAQRQCAASVRSARAFQRRRARPRRSFRSPPPRRRRTRCR